MTQAAMSFIYDTLKDDAGVSALVGARIYPLVMPDGVTLPALVYQRISADRIMAMNATAGDGIGRHLIQVTAWATTLAQAHEVQDAVRDAMAISSSSPPAAGLHDADYPDTYDPETRLYATVSAYVVWYT